MHMVLRLFRATLCAAVLFWAVRDLTGNSGMAALAALVPLGLGIPNYLPFAVVALPAIAVVAALVARFQPELGIDAAATILRENAEQVRTILSAQLRD